MTIISILLFSLFACETKPVAEVISASEFHNALIDNNVQLLDVRTMEEYNSGHIDGALNANWNNSEEFSERTKALDKEKAVYVYCLSGGRSQQAMNWLSAQGFKKVYNLEGGIRSWTDSNYPVTNGEKKADLTIKQLNEFINSGTKVLVDVGAPWCPPCQKMKPVMAQLEEEGYKVLEVNGDKNSHISDYLKVDKFPEFLVFENGKEIKRFIGIVDINELRESLK